MKMKILHRRSLARTGVILLTVLSMGVFFAIPGLSVTGSSFESADGNMVVDGGAAAHDWTNAPNLDPVTDQASGSNDDAYKGGAKHDDICPAVAAGGIPPNKDDLLRFYVSHEVVGTSTFLYLGWVRFLSKESSASAHIDFEFNQGSTPCSSTNKLIQRTPGDILIFYDLEGGGNPVLSLAKWITTGHVPATYACAGAGSGTVATGCWGAPNGTLINLSAAGIADGAINNGSISDEVNGGTLPFSREFGEAGIDITSFLPAGTCEGFSKANLGSRSSGNSADSTMKDFVLGDVHVNNCGSLKVKKVDPDGNPLAGAKFKVYLSDGDASFEPNAVNGDGQIGKDGAASTAAAAECTTTSDGVGDCVYSNLAPGTRYWVDETQAPPGFNPPSPTYVLSAAISSGTETLVTVTDTPALGDVKIVKRDDAGNLLGGVAFTLVGTSDAGGSVNTGCTTSSTAGADFGTCTILNVQVGTGYTLDEGTLPTGYSRDPAFPKTVNVVEGGVGNNTFSAANPRLHRVIVIVCHEGTDTLYSSTDNVKFNGTSKSSISSVPSGLAGKGVTESDLCNIGGAQYNDLPHTVVSPSPSPYAATVAIPGH